MLDTSYLNQLKKFSIIVQKRVTSSYSGARRSIATGRGITIKDFREYSKGDDIRRIDWRLFSRTDRLYVRQYEEERNFTIHIILDASASMNFGKPYTKFEYGALLGVGFAYLGMRDNDRFEFTTFANELSPIKPKKGMSQLASIVESLNKIKPSGDSKFEQNMNKLRHFIRSRSLIIVISDYLFDISEIHEGLMRLSNGNHEIKVIQVLDREEKDLPIEGDIRLHDSESDAVILTYLSKHLKQKYMQKLNDHSSKIHDVSYEARAKFYQVCTDEPIFDSFYKVLYG